MSPKVNYLLIKYDKHFRVDYANQELFRITGVDISEVIGTKMDRSVKFVAPHSYLKYMLNSIEDHGYFNGYVFLNHKQKNYCYFSDFGRRYAADGTVLGYETVLYNASEQGEAFTKKLYQKLEEAEGNASQEESIASGLHFLTDYLSQLDSPYEEYVHHLQSAD